MFVPSHEQLEDPRAAKIALRRRLVDERHALSLSDRQEAARAIAEAALTSPTVADATCLTAYVGVGAEPGTGPLLAALHRAGVRVLLPVVAPDRRLEWAPYRGREALAAGAWGLLEPTGPRLAAAAAAEADLLLVPALAVDRQGRRLGRGGGYYDRLLAALPGQQPVVAVVYRHELLDAVPVNGHDMPVSAALTPDGLLEFGSP